MKWKKSGLKVVASLLAVGLLFFVLSGFIGEVTKEVPMPLPLLAKKIREGEIDVGKEYGLAFDKRYHKIHADVLGLDCSACHITTSLTAQQEVFAAQDVSPHAPGPVERRACSSCHGPGGPARELYGPPGP